MSVFIAAGHRRALRTAAAVACAVGLATGTAGLSAAQPAPAAPSATDERAVVDKVTFDVTYITSGQRAREGEYPYPGYTATVDPADTERAASLAHLIADGLAGFTPGLQTTNRIPTGWAHQREIISRGTYTPRTAGAYEDALYGYGAGTDGAPDIRFELMAGPKAHTAVGVALVPETGEVVVVAVNGYAAEPAVGPVVAPVPVDTGTTPGPDSPTEGIPQSVRDAVASGLLTSSSQR